MIRLVVLTVLLLSTTVASTGCSSPAADPAAAPQRGENTAELASLRKELFLARMKLSVVRKKIDDPQLPNLQGALKRLHSDLQTEIEQLVDQIKQASQLQEDRSAS